MGALALTLILPGCLAPHIVLEWVAPVKTLAPVSPEGWHEGNWFAYHAHFPTRNRSIDVSLIIYEERENEFILGSNSTYGFFGLPFAGNVTRPDLNPVISGEEWPLFRFPLEAGKTWDYQLFGYPVTARAVETEIGAGAGMPAHTGFEIEATSYGQLVARYTYSPIAQWFTTMTVFDASNGDAVITVSLTDFGTDFAGEYYVSVPLKTVSVVYPSLKSGETFRLPGEYESLTAILKIGGTAGRFEARLVDPDGRTRAEGDVLVQGVHMSRHEFPARAGEYTLDHRGVGDGFVRLELYGIAVADKGSLTPAKPPAEPDEFRWAPFGPPPAAAAGQRTVADLPHVGQEMATGSPL